MGARQRLAELGIVGDGIEGYGCPALSPLACGLVHMELHRGDGSLGTFLGVQAGPGDAVDRACCGSEEQKQRWLPAWPGCEKIGAFALTEPEHGSDSVALETTARRDGDDWVINGAKRWIGNGSDRRRHGRLGPRRRGRQVKGFLVETRHARLRRRGDRGQGRRCARSGRPTSASTACACPAATGCPARNTFKDTGRVLATTRGTCAWGALGPRGRGYDAALTYAKQRKQFGKPLASFQIVQHRLVKMLAEVTAMQLYCMQVARLADAGQADRHHRRRWRS